MTITVDSGNISSKGDVAKATSPQTWDHTTGADVDLIVVTVTIYDASSSDGIVSAVSFDGKALASSFVEYDAASDGHVSVWWRANADIANIDPGTISVTFGGEVTDFEASAVGVEGTVGTFAKDSTANVTKQNGSATVTWPTVATNTIAFDAVITDQSGDKNTANGTQVEIHNTDLGNDFALSSYNILSSSGSQTMSWTDTDDDEDYITSGTAFYEVSAPVANFQDVDGVLTPAGTIVKSGRKVLSGVSTLSGVISKATTKTFTGSSTPVGSLIKQAQKIFSGSFTPSGVLAITKITLLSIVGSITASGILVKQAGKMASGVLAPVGTLIRQAAKSFTGSVTATGTLIKQAGKVLLGSLAPSGTLIKETAKAFIGSLTAVGSLVTQKSGGGLFQVVGGALTMAGALTRRTGKQTAGIITMTGSITRQISKNVSGVLTAIGTLVKQVGKLVVGSITAVGTLARRYSGFPTPDRRIFAIASENRICSIASENRIYSIPRGVTT